MHGGPQEGRAALALETMASALKLNKKSRPRGHIQLHPDRESKTGVLGSITFGDTEDDYRQVCVQLLWSPLIITSAFDN